MKTLRKCGDAYFSRSGSLEDPTTRYCRCYATRISHIYDGVSIYVCDAPFTGDHEYAEPWDDTSIHELSCADEARKLNNKLLMS